MLLYDQTKLKNKHEVFNLSSGQKYNVKNILKKIIKAGNKKSNYPIKQVGGTKGDSFGFHTKRKDARTWVGGMRSSTGGFRMVESSDTTR